VGRHAEQIPEQPEGTFGTPTEEGSPRRLRHLPDMGVHDLLPGQQAALLRPQLRERRGQLDPLPFELRLLLGRRARQGVEAFDLGLQLDGPPGQPPDPGSDLLKGGCQPLRLGLVARQRPLEGLPDGQGAGRLLPCPPPLVLRVAPGLHLAPVGRLGLFELRLPQVEGPSDVRQRALRERELLLQCEEPA